MLQTFYGHHIKSSLMNKNNSKETIPETCSTAVLHHVYKQMCTVDITFHFQDLLAAVHFNHENSEQIELEVEQRHLGHHTAHLGCLCAVPDYDVISPQDAIYLIIWGRFPGDHQPGLIKMYCDVPWINRWHCGDKKRRTAVIYSGRRVGLLVRRLFGHKAYKKNRKWGRNSSDIFDCSMVCTMLLRQAENHSTEISHVEASGRKFKTSPPSKCRVFSQQDHSHFLCDPSGKPCSGRDIFVTVGCQAEQVVGQLPLHSRDYMQTVSRLTLSTAWKGKR